MTLDYEQTALDWTMSMIWPAAESIELDRRNRPSATAVANNRNRLEFLKDIARRQGATDEAIRTMERRGREAGRARWIAVTHRQTTEPKEARHDR